MTHPSTRLSDRLTYANVAATLALVVAVGGSGGAAYAAMTKNSVRSVHIVNGQVKTPDLAKGAVRSGKLAPGSVTSAKIADKTIRTADLGMVHGVATAGATVQSDGTVRGWFNRRGGAPSVTTFGVGNYSVKLPGHSPAWEKNMVAVTSATNGVACSWDLDAPAAVDVLCRSLSTGAAAPASFSLLVY